MSEEGAKEDGADSPPPSQPSAPSPSAPSSSSSPPPLSARSRRSKSSTRTAAILGVVAALLAGGIVLRELGFIGHAHRGSSPRDAIPASSFLTIAIDLKAVRAASWWPTAEKMAGGEAGNLLGLPSLQTTCGYDPTASIDEVAVAVPEGGEHGDFGVAMGGNVDVAKLAECVKKVVAANSANAATSTNGQLSNPSNEAPVIRERQGFHLLDQAGVPRFALREGGPYLVGRGDWLLQMIDSAAGATPSWRTNDAHQELLHALATTASSGSATDDLGGRAIVMTALLPNSVRDRVRREMANETSDTDEASRRTMNGVLGVSGAALGITLAPAIPSSPETPHDAELAVEMRCETDEACAAVAKLLLEKRLALAKDMRLRFLGLGGALDSLTVEAEGRALHARLHFNPDSVLAALQRILPPPTPARAPMIAPTTVPEATPSVAPAPSSLFVPLSPPDAGARPNLRDGGAHPTIQDPPPTLDSRD